MRERIKRVMLCLVAAVFMSVSLLSAAAFADTERYESSADFDGVNVSISTDKTEYKSGDTVNVTLNINNQSKKSVVGGKVTWKVDPAEISSKDLPAALKSVPKGKEGKISGSFVISMEGIEGTPVDNGSSNGAFPVVPVVIAVVVIVLAAVIVVVMKKKGKKAPTAVLFVGFLALSLSVGALCGVKQASAAGDVEKIAAYVSCDGKEVCIRASIQVNLGEKTQSLDYADQVKYSTVAVHDPSIIKVDGMYYVFGSHQAVGKSEDLMNWTNAAYTYVDGLTGNTAYSTNAYKGTVKTQNGEVAFKPSNGDNFDGRAFAGYYLNGDRVVTTEAQLSTYLVNGGTNLWAPDIIYNETMGKYCMYMSLNGQKWNSTIVLLTSDDILGPYEYQGPVVYSGFVADASQTGVYYKNTDLELVYGELASLPGKYNHANDWGTYLPHCIDPAVEYDSEGNLWMIYGSWSGGIYALQLDETTGLRDYTVQYPNEGEGLPSCTSDAYFGTKVAGGGYVSGEGAYVEKIGDYYWLFVSYGFYEAGTGYNMRVYRSENIDGPYVDLNGNSAIFKNWELNHASRQGIRIMGGYKWPYMIKGSTAQGHNSAYVDEDGKAYVIYHRKFDDGTQGHQVETHQLYLNEDGWMVTAPFKYAGETISETGYDKSEIVGEYDVIIHTKNVFSQAQYDSKQATDIHGAKTVMLNEDGTVTGEYTGTWTAKDGTYYMTITIDGEEYKGVFSKGFLEESSVEVMTFSAVGGANQYMVWGAQVYEN